MNIERKFMLLPVVDERLRSVSTALNRSQDLIVNESLLRTLNIEGVTLDEETIWGPQKERACANK